MAKSASKKMAFLVVMGVWILWAPQRTLHAEFVALVSCGSPVTLTAFDDGWFCSDSPGAAEHNCLYDKWQLCQSACSTCNRVYYSPWQCTSNRSPGPSPGDPLAADKCLIDGQWAQYLSLTCSCGAVLCSDVGSFCMDSSECCSNLACNYGTETCEGDPSPLLIDVTSRSPNFNLTSAAEGVSFDIDADGASEQVAWTSAGSDVAFVVLDRNQNGVIDDGSELFGTATPTRDGKRAVNGFMALYDLDGGPGVSDGILNASDQAYGEIRLWVDANHNGVSEGDELTSLADAGVITIFTKFRESSRVDRHGNRYKFVGEARVMKNGHERSRRVFDVFPQVIRQ